MATIYPKSTLSIKAFDSNQKAKTFSVGYVKFSQDNLFNKALLNTFAKKLVALSTMSFDSATISTVNSISANENASYVQLANSSPFGYNRNTIIQPLIEAIISETSIDTEDLDEADTILKAEVYQNNSLVYESNISQNTINTGTTVNIGGLNPEYHTAYFKFSGTVYTSGAVGNTNVEIGGTSSDIYAIIKPFEDDEVPAATQLGAALLKNFYESLTTAQKTAYFPNAASEDYTFKFTL